MLRCRQQNSLIVCIGSPIILVLFDFTFTIVTFHVQLMCNLLVVANFLVCDVMFFGI